MLLLLSISFFIISRDTLPNFYLHIFISSIHIHIIYKDKRPPPIEPMVEDSQGMTAIGKQNGISSVTSFLFLFSKFGDVFPGAGQDRKPLEGRA